MLEHRTDESFWRHYYKLPADIQLIADKQYRLLQDNPAHPSLQLKSVGKFWSVRVTQNYRAVAIRIDGGFYWFWIGSHDEYERIIK